MKKGYFGEFGGCFVPELLMPPLLEVEAANSRTSCRIYCTIMRGGPRL